MSGLADKTEELRKIFTPHLTSEERYLRIIDLGRALPPYPDGLKKPDLQVQGCQSLLYLSSTFFEGRLFFQAHADALISAGLAAVLISVYGNEAPEDILRTPPLFLKELGILGSLSPSRSNGLANIHLRMKRDALSVIKLDIKLDANLASC